MGTRKKQNKIKDLAFILAGGQSLRLFPLQRPKPLFEISGKSLLEMTLERLRGFDCYVVTNSMVGKSFKEYFKAKRKAAPKMLFEPEGRDTAAAVGFALRQFRDDRRRVAILSADHYIPQLQEYRRFLKTAMRELDRYPESLFVAGSPARTKPTPMHSQFGWIVPKQKSFEASVAVKRFVEKPSGRRLSSIKKSGGLINAGTFFGRLGTFREAYERFYPKVLDPKHSYGRLERQPIDRAIFENFDLVRSLSLKLDWEDLGTWSTIDEKLGSMPIYSSNASSNFFWTDEDSELYIEGLSNYCVVQANSRILIIPKSKAGDLKNLLKGMK